MKIAVTGKHGMLSSYLYQLDSALIQLDSKNFDITDRSILQKLEQLDIDIIIHAAAITNSSYVNDNPVHAIQTNIVGTGYISEYCIKHNKRLVYISTDYVYPSNTNGDHLEDSVVLPYNNYAWTKLGGECSVKLVPIHLIIRTSFGSTQFPYNVAYTNQIVSKDYIDIIAPRIMKASISEVVGTLNIGTEPKTMYEYARRRNNVKPIEKTTNTNFTLNTEKYVQSFSY